MQFHIQTGQVKQSLSNAEYANSSQARNMAMSGMEMGIREMHDDFGWRPDPQPWTITISGHSTDVYIDDDQSHPSELQSNQVRVRAESKMGSQTGNAHAILQLDNIFPKIPAALGFYTDETMLNINGSAFEFNGKDTNPDGTSGTEDDLPGVAADTSAYDTLLDNLNNNQKAKVEDGVYEEQILDNEDLQEHIDKYADVAETYNSSSTSPLGSPEEPKIVSLDAGGEAKDESGAGILIIPEGSTFTAKGDFTFHGLIIVQGTLDLRGHVTLFGSMLFGGESQLDIPDEDDGTTFSGSVTVNYSSSALANANNKLAHKFGDGVEVASIYD
ncbi:MAG: hypothetical protein WD266_10790 [Balneolales bacterium]